jgi:hypothetical protein
MFPPAPLISAFFNNSNDPNKPKPSFGFGSNPATPSQNTTSPQANLNTTTPASAPSTAFGQQASGFGSTGFGASGTGGFGQNTSSTGFGAMATKPSMFGGGLTNQPSAFGGGMASVHESLT